MLMPVHIPHFFFVECVAVVPIDVLVVDAFPITVSLSSSLVEMLCFSFLHGRLLYSELYSELFPPIRSHSLRLSLPSLHCGSLQW